MIKEISNLVKEALLISGLRQALAGNSMETIERNQAILIDQGGVLSKQFASAKVLNDANKDIASTVELVSKHRQMPDFDLNNTLKEYAKRGEFMQRFESISTAIDKTRADISTLIRNTASEVQGIESASGRVNVDQTIKPAVGM